ncbi:uncharacterized protein LOC114540615 [Dendronephthya gigantea]|uniref:uncharacterized protein LOC114540615 n=1 Tax=Dendronephthya gigantea TaxID=151771 RepID=UPI00106B9002|nr:uncharacterized protein LOC114540615 [Dendronephthya gigantea]
MAAFRSKTLLFALLTVVLLVCTRGESYDFKDEAEGLPSENEWSNIDEEYQEDHIRVTPSLIQPSRTAAGVQQTPTPRATPTLGFSTTRRLRFRRFRSRRATSRRITRPPRPTRRPRPTFRPSVCPFDCGLTCVVPRRTIFQQSYVCVLPIYTGCQRCCETYASCRRSNIPQWICYQRALDCVCGYRSRYRNIRCYGRRCIGKLLG